MHVNRFAIATLCIFAWAAPWAEAQAPAKPQPSAKSRIHDMLVLKNSQSINGNVKVTTFTLRTGYGDVPLKKSDILAVDYRKPPNRMQDEVQLSAGTRLYGDLQPTPIPIDVEELGTVFNIPKDDILTMILQRPIENVSQETEQALRARKKP